MAIQQLTQQLDLVALAGTSLRQSGRYFIGPCPFCGGRDRFNIKRTDEGDVWLCRQCGDGRYHDAAAFLMRRDGLTFPQVLAAIGSAASPWPSPATAPKTAAQTAMDHPPDDTWQVAALAALGDCCQQLDGNGAAWRYLEGRGLLPETIRGASLGYNPTWREFLSGCWLAPGITIPGMVNGQLWYVQVRTTKAARDAAAQRGKTLGKYSATTGSKLKTLYGADRLLTAKTAVITEGEFDTLLLSQFLPAGVTAVTMGAASTLPDNLAWLRYFAGVQRALLVMDNDAAGAHAVKKWRSLLPWVELLPVPRGFKDVTDFWQAGGDVAKWVGEVLSTWTV